MSTLSSCIKKAGKSLNKSDADAIKALRDDLRTDGLDPQQAAIEAVVGHIQSLLAEHNELTSDASYLPSTPVYDSHTAPAGGEDSVEQRDAEDRPAEIDDNPPAIVDDQPTENVSEPARRIEDFGAKLEGARKDYASKLSEAKQADTIKVTLAESWPEPDYQKLLDIGIPAEAVALSRAMRDEIPNKPRASWKLRGWAEKVETLRDFAGDMLLGAVDAKMVRERMEGISGHNMRGLEKVGGRADLYQEFGHDRSLKGISFSKAHWNLYHGQENVTLWMVERRGTTMNNMPHTLAKGETREEALEAFRKVYAKLDETADKKATRFDIYTNRETKEVFIGKKIGRNVVPVKRNLESVKAAREYLANNQDELDQALAKIKEIPSHRKETNSPRVGANHRNNGDVSPEEFSEAFGFRGVQFGNYVEQGKRQQDLNRAYDALMDLAGILGIPPRALSLNGELGLAFGSQGKGGKDAPAAHYAPGTVVINLTKREGAGTLAHEWFHALDNYFSRDRGAKSAEGYATEGRSALTTRPEVAEAMRNIIQTITRTGIKERSRKLDRVRIKAYWTTDREMAARAFESYVIEKLNDHEASNDYLANIVSEEYWEAAAALGLEKEGSYPYPQAAEIPDIRAAFDNLFGVIESRETDQGVGLFSRSQSTRETYEARIDELFDGADPNNQSGVRVLDSSDVLGLLGYGDYEVLLAEKHAVSDGRFNHPQFTADDWKQVPEWLENPVAVFERDDGNLTVIAPETKNGMPIIIGVSPDIESPGVGRGRPRFHLLLTAYDKDSGKMPLDRMVREGQLRYVDQRKTPGFNRDAGHRLPSHAAEIRGLGAKIHTGADLFKYKRSKNEAGLSRATEQKAGNVTPADVQAVADKLGESWDIDVNVIASSADLPESAKAEMKRQGITGGITGYYDRKTKAIYLVADAMRSKHEAQVTLLHEAVGHLGIELVMGKDINDFLRSVYDARNSDPAIKAAWEHVNRPSTYGDAPRIVQAAEVVARIAESDPKHTIVQRFIQMARQALRKMGFSVPFKNGDIIEALRRARRALEDGAYAGEGAGGGLFQAGYHGSPHRHTKFSLDKVGTGEGTQAYGYGLYFAQKRDVAEYYRNMTAGKDGHLYTVDVPEDHELLDWDARLSEQSDQVREAIYGSDILGRSSPGWKGAPEGLFEKNVGSRTGEDIYQDLSSRFGNDQKAASEYLKSLGIPGLRYFDHMSRHQPPPVPAFDAWAGYHKGADLDTISDRDLAELRDEYQEFVDAEDARTRNFVIFDDERIEITDTLFRADDDESDTQHSRVDISRRDFLKTASSVAGGAGQGGISYSYTTGGGGQPPVNNQPPQQPAQRQPSTQPLRASVRDRLDAFRFQMQDKLIDLKRIQEDADPADDANAYQKAAIWEGKAGERLNDFDEERVQPLLQAIAQSGLPWNDVGEWLVARHAKEANAYLAEINPDMDPAKRFRLSGMTDQRADSILAQHSGNRNLTMVGDLVDQINQDRVDMLVDDGLISRDMARAWQSRYKHYVPLKRDEADGADLLPARGQGFNIKGKESKMRTGSADWTPGKIVANTLAQYEASIVRAEKNKVGQALLEFVNQNPDDSFWEVDTDRTVKSVRNGKVVEGHKGFDSPNELTVKKDGKEHVIVFNPGNPRAVRLVTGLKNLQAAEMGSVMRGMATVTRYLATINTSWNPEFMVSNFARDVQTAAYNLSDTDIADMRGRVIKDIPAAMNGIRSALFGDSSANWAPIWEDFRKNGGKTGWLDIHGDVLKKEQDLKKMAERLAEGKPSRGQIVRFIKAVEGMNNVIENGVRLAAYKNALDAGLSKDRAAALAKDLTVNFNRKGNWGPTINALYMFYNAAVQGNVRLIQTLANSKQGRRMAYATIGFAVALDILNRALSGDDDDGENIYDTLPDYVKDRNIILMWGKEPVVKIPAPWGYNVLHTIGQVIGQAMTGDRFNALDSAARVGLSFIDAFNPVGSGTVVQVISPTIADPIMQMAENKNFAGNPLKPEHTYDSRAPKPEYLMHWSTSREASKTIAKFLNDASGGNEIRPGKINISPEWLDLILETATGGLGTTMANTVDTATRMVSGKEIPTENIPFVRKVTGHNNEYGVKGRYYEWGRGVAYAKSEARTLRGQDLVEARKNPEHQLIGLYAGTEKQLTAMRKIRRQMVERGASEDAIEKQDERIRVVMARFNKAYAETVLK